MHHIACGCDKCAPPGPATRTPIMPRLMPGDRFAILTLTGTATGLAIIAVIDRVIAGPGLLAAFGF